MHDAASDILAGTAAGIAQVAVGHPLDTLKVRLQTQSRALYANFGQALRLTLREGKPHSQSH